jgi:hypothetical protein
MRALSTLAVLGSLFLAPTRSPVQLSVAVEPISLDVRGDTARVGYSVTNASSSTMKLFMFTVDAPAPAIRVEAPPKSANSYINTGTSFGRSVASWGFLKRLAPGMTSPPLAFSAIGLPGIVKYWATPFVAPGREETPDVRIVSGAPIGPGNTAADSGLTVGVVPFPTDRSDAVLNARLRTLLARACGDLGWIGSEERVGASERIGTPSRPAKPQRSLGREDSEQGGSEVCRDLDGKLAKAERALARGATDDARDAIMEFAHKLDSMRHSHEHERMSGAGYALLRGNATYLLARWPGDEDKGHAHDRKSGTRTPDSE